MVRVVVFISLICVSVFFSIYVASQWKSYHDFTGKCQDCHLNDPGKAPSQMLFTKDISTLCLSCHKEQRELSHPVDVKPSFQVPDVFPLDWKNDVTCNTCHPTHNPGFGKYRLRVGSIGQVFCIKCHSGLADGSGLHRGRTGSAHVGRGVRNRYIPGSGGQSLDDLSMRCLTCHDASFAKDSLVKTGTAGGNYYHKEDTGPSHPVGVLYVETPAYSKIADLPASIRLFDGTVGCGSCHNPYSKMHFELTVTVERSELCFACHLK
jgi:predicted CXXCH cytochrome family protein